MGTDGLEQLVDRLFEVTGVPRHPPVSIEELAGALGVRSIQSAAMVEDGRLELRDGRPSIFVRAGVAPARRRFTIAHELAHLILADPREDLVAHRIMNGGFDAEERFCDALAAAILMPRSWVSTSFEGAPERLLTARRMSERSKTSLSATILRLREVLGWRRSFLYWRRIEGQWRLLSAAGTPPQIADVGSDPGTRQALERLMGEPVSERAGLLPLRVNQAVRMVRAEISVRGGGAVALAELNGI